MRSIISQRMVVFSVPNLESLSRQAKESENSEEQEQVVVARVLSSFRPKEESSRALRHREQLLQRRASGSSNSSFWYRKHRGSMDSLVEAPSPSTPMHQAQKESYLTGSKILLTMPTSASSPETSSSKEKTSISQGFHSSSRYLPVEIRSSSQAPLENHWMDECNSKITPLPPHCRAFPLQTQINTKPFSPIPHPCASAGASSMPAMPRRISAGGYHAAAQGLAPMVHIRTVIPVCATPPMRLPASNATVHKQEQDDEVSAATSKLTNLQL